MKIHSEIGLCTWRVLSNLDHKIIVKLGAICQDLWIFQKLYQTNRTDTRYRHRPKRLDLV